MSGPDIPT